MKIIALYYQGIHRNEKQEINELFVGFSGLEKDVRSEIFSGQIPIKVIENLEDATNWKGENIVLLAENNEKPELLDLISNEKVCLEICLDTRNAKTDNELGFGNGIQCTLPENGYFARVVKEGEISEGDEFQLIKKVFQAQIITLSDRASRGIYEDLSGNQIESMLKNSFSEWKRNLEVTRVIIPDEVALLQSAFLQAVENKTDIVITNGGTGIGSRDITPESIRPLLHKEIPGIMEMIRLKYGVHIPTALISRTFAGIRNKTLVYALPGSKKAVSEYMNEILPTLNHSLLMVQDVKAH